MSSLTWNQIVEILSDKEKSIKCISRCHYNVDEKTQQEKAIGNDATISLMFQIEVLIGVYLYVKENRIIANAIRIYPGSHMMETKYDWVFDFGLASEQEAISKFPELYQEYQNAFSAISELPFFNNVKEIMKIVRANRDILGIQSA